MIAPASWLAVLATILVPATAAADPLQDRVLAAMKATRTADVGFVQTTRIERDGAPPKVIVTRYDPSATARWSVVSVDGRAPTSKERADITKTANRAPVRGYSRLAEWFGTPATRVGDTQGRVTFRFAHLPKGVFKMGSHDASATTTADAVVNTTAPTPYVERVRFASTKAFRMMLVAKVDRYVATSSYAPLPDGRPFTSGTDVDIAGALMGKAGKLRTTIRYAEVRVAR